MSREVIYQALFEKLRYCAQFATTGRRLKHWGDASVQQPALFVVAGPYQHYPEADYLRPREPRFDAEVWLYFKNPENINADDAPAPEAGLNDLIDAVERTLAGDEPFQSPQTLGITGVLYCRIEGRIEIDPGHLSGQAIAIVPVAIGVAESLLVGGI